MKMDIFLWKKESARGNIRENATKRGQSKRIRTDLRRKTKGKAITEKPKDKIKKQAYYTEKTKQKQARQVGSHSLPHSSQKIQADFLSKRPHFSRLLPLFHLKPPYPETNSHSILRAGHAPTRIYALALSANLPFSPSPFTSHRNKLYINRLSVKANPAFTFTATSWKTTRCTTSIAKNRWR